LQFRLIANKGHAMIKGAEESKAVIAFFGSHLLLRMTALEQRYCMAQRYLPAILEGDKRILVVDGTPLPYVLARIPASGELRGNLAAGGHGVAQPLSASDRAICTRVAPELTRRGLVFVGLDVIGDRLTEINVTSPTCAREIEAAYDIDIGGLLMQAIADRLARSS